MELSQLRTLFKDLSGRADLDDSTVDMYLNEGQNFLDDQTEHVHSPGEVWGAVAVGDFKFLFINKCRSITQVELIDSPNLSVTELLPLSLRDLKLLNPKLIADVDQGWPAYYARAAIRRIPDHVDLSVTNKRIVIETGDQSQTNGIVFNCPIDRVCEICVSGKFYNPDFHEATEAEPYEVLKTWWSQYYGLTLVHAALYKLDAGYRNTEGMKDWLNAISPVVKDINHNYIEEVASRIPRMEG